MTNDAQPMPNERNMDNVIQIILRVGTIPAIGPDDDIYDAGFSSIRAFQLLTELESIFDVTIEDDLFRDARTPRALFNLVQSPAQ
jgi:acyl carrier protein